MNKKINKYNLYIITCIIITLICIFLLRYKLIILINNAMFSKKIISLNLTTEEKLDDFEEFYNNIIKSVPLLDDHEKMYGISFKERKPYYQKLVEKTQNDFEFFCTMSAIEEDIPSFHTDIVSPSYSRISNLKCYNKDKTLSSIKYKALTDYWYETIYMACEQYSEVQRANFKYIDGEYLFDSLYSSDVYKEFNRYSIDTINGDSISDFIINNISTYSIHYDYGRNTPYRWYFTLNDSVGEKVMLTLCDEDGNLINIELYYDIQIEVVDAFSEIYLNKDIISENNSIYYYTDKKNDIGYVAIKNFENSYGKELKNELSKMKYLENIIIDLRGNYGGYREYAQKYLYPVLFNIDVTTTNSWYIPNSDINRVVNNKINNRLLFKRQKDEEGYTYTSKYKYKGESLVTKQSIFILIDRKTASAADGFVAMVKEKNLGFIIGSNTSGEGLADSFIVERLSESGLTYIYYPSLSYNVDGTNNSLYGTSPHQNIEQSKESFYIQRDMQARNQDTNSYIEKLKYDNVLINTIEIIKNNRE